eukprot:TRINITY_DN310_c0_g3_i2.p4 TRINITY_DN310_c0_g3~~TRINITY_DN310_c0_g3_i2.p4  ORF type:complete len:105 (-),score=33.64 TRINITY_DN310_c0_g3_i2:79-393(-)
MTKLDIEQKQKEEEERQDKEMELKLKELKEKKLGSSSSDGDPYPCCLYSKKEYYWTEPIMTECMNPDYQAYCSSTTEGLTLIGNWLVSEIENQCYFVVNGTNGP